MAEEILNKRNVNIAPEYQDSQALKRVHHDQKARELQRRFHESERERVQTITKPFCGGRLSTGEAIRRLAEERLDEITRANVGRSLRDTLLRLLSDWCARRRRVVASFPSPSPGSIGVPKNGLLS